MVRVHFCVYIEPSAGRAVQQMRQDNQKHQTKPNKPLTKQINNKQEGGIRGRQKKRKDEIDFCFCFL